MQESVGHGGTSQVHLIVVPHTHWDREWYQSFQDFRRRLVRLTDRLLEVLERDAEFRHFHLDGQTIVLEDYLEIRPQNRPRLRRLIRAGRIGIGPWYVLPDEFLVSGESIIRNLVIGHRVAAAFGRPLKIGYLPDQFGHIAQMPQLLAGCGIDNAVVWRGVGADVDRTEFLWEAPNGSRVFTVYLPHSGYSNGRSLPAEPVALRERLQAQLTEVAPFRRTDTALILNGTDHQEAQAHVPAALAEAVRGMEGITAEVAPLATYIARARQATENVALPVHRGELRSPVRAHLLPGVTSARGRQKQRDFDNVSCLERYAEPLATWLDGVEGRRNLTDFTDWAWKLAVQNHPHDSICGCSIDQVHQDMEYRFDQGESVVKRVVQQALSALAARMDTSAAHSDTVLAVYNPNHAARAAITAEIYHDQPDSLALRDMAGHSVALQASAGTSETLLDTELPPAEVRPHVATIQGREFLGLFINAIHFSREAERLEVRLTVDRVLRGQLDIAGQRAHWLQSLDDPALKAVKIVARSATPVQLRFIGDLVGHGFTFFTFATDGGQSPAPFTATAQAFENRFYRVSFNPADGSIAVFDKEMGRELPRCNWFVDEGDRGDEYNFDALLDPQRVESPAQPPVVTIDAAGPVTATLRIEMAYALPCRLEADRETRSRERVSVPIRTAITLYADVKRIDFDTEIDNAVEDHRLRVHFHTPVQARSAHYEQAFAVVERSLDLEPAGSFEQPIGTVPQKTFACVEGNGVGVALFNRGIPEIEAVPTAAGVAFAVTLVRSVGWLSRGDLHMRNGHAGPGLETPGGQSPGQHRFSYALTTYAGDHVSVRIVNRAHEFAYPPVAVVTDRHGGAGTPPILLACDNPHVVVSAVTPASRPERVLVRCYNSTRTTQVARLELAGATRVRCVDFLEQTSRKRVRREAGAWEVTLAPAEIVTLQVSRRR